MNRPVPENKGLVRRMREIRDQIGEEIAGMDHEALQKWLKERRFDDPKLQGIADEAARKAAAEVNASGEM